MHKAGLVLAALFVMGYAQVDHFDFTIAPGAKTAGKPFSVTIEAKDASGNLVDFNGFITLSIPKGEITPTEVRMSGGRWSGDVTIYWADPQVKIKCEGGGKSSESQPFAVSPGPPKRLQIIFPGEKRAPGTRGSGKSGKPFGGVAWYTGVPCSTWVYYTDEWWNVVNQEIEVTFTSTDKYYKTEPKFPFKFRGERLIFSTFTQVGCPFPEEGYKIHDVWIKPTTRTDIDSNATTGIMLIPDTIVHKILFVCPGDTPEPGAEKGLTPGSKAKVYAFHPETLYVYGTDKAYNEVKGKYLPPDSVWLEASPPAGVEFHYGLLEDTTKKKGVLKPGGTKFLAWVTTDNPGPGEQRFTVEAIAKFDTYVKDLFWEAMPNLLIFATGEPPDSVPVNVKTPVTVILTAGGNPYISERVDFELIKGEGDFDRTSAFTNEEGKVTVYFTPTSPGPTVIKASVHRFPQISNTKTIAVTSPKPIFVRPNPWELGNKVKLYYVLDKDVRNVTVLISDIFGNIVWKKSYDEGDPETRAGTQVIEWNGTNMKGEKVANSIYLVKVKPAGAKTLHTKIVVVR